MFALPTFIQPSLEKFRHEKKYLLEEADSTPITLILKRHPAVFREIYYERVVHNIYFDNHDLDDYYDNINGANIRKKIRLRWYSQEQDFLTTSHSLTPVPQLEIKLKQADSVKKIIFSQEKLPAKLITQLPPVIRSYLHLESTPAPVSTKSATTTSAPFFPDNSTDSTLFKLGLLHPTVYNSYRRRYYLSADGKIRATIDQDLEFRSINSHQLDLGFAIKPNLSILELKSELDNLDELTDAAQYLPFLRQRTSKYALGLASLERHDY